MGKLPVVFIRNNYTHINSFSCGPTPIKPMWSHPIKPLTSILWTPLISRPQQPTWSAHHPITTPPPPRIPLFLYIKPLLLLTNLPSHNHKSLSPPPSSHNHIAAVEPPPPPPCKDEVSLLLWIWEKWSPFSWFLLPLPQTTRPKQWHLYVQVSPFLVYIYIYMYSANPKMGSRFLFYFWWKFDLKIESFIAEGIPHFVAKNAGKSR